MYGYAQNRDYLEKNLNCWKKTNLHLGVNTTWRQSTWFRKLGPSLSEEQSIIFKAGYIQTCQTL